MSLPPAALHPAPPAPQPRADMFGLSWDTDAPKHASSTAAPTEITAPDEPTLPHATLTLSLFESIFTSYPPILESLLAQIPTATVLQLYHTSRYLRDFLRRYPLAWKTLSFRLPLPAPVAGSPSNDEGPDGDRLSKMYAFDALLKRIICPYGTRLTNLDLCNTSVSGIALVGSILSPRIDSLRHLSVRGCKNVSIKYHIVPFLEPYTVKNSPWQPKDLALKSLYTYRCRHHRRRPYLPSSLIRRDSDSDPTHQLILICHQLGIWTDTAWCPTPGGRCFRRKDYHAGRAGPLNLEVWVPFDKLWRCSNRIGPVESETKLDATDGRVWELSETGHDGEPLGPEDSQCKGEGKHVPAHLRKSHTMFVEGLKCAQCHDLILERCESCSVRMHCMGCRKTLCASCAFNRPIPRKRAKTRHFANLAFGPGSTLGSTLSQAAGSASHADQSQTPKPEPTNRFWWAPGATRSPNIMNESAQEDDSSDSEDGGTLANGLPMPPTNREPPKLNMHWCCLEPIFSGGGGIAMIGTGLGGRGADKIRAAPLPRTKEYEDPDFSNQLRPVDYVREMKNNGLYEYVLGEDVDVLSYLKQDSLELQAHTCPRGLCNDCYRSFRWKVSCRACKNPLCKEHDFRGLKFRKCGYRDMRTEREFARTHQETPRLVIPEFNANKPSSEDAKSTSTAPSKSKLTDPRANLADSHMSQSQILLLPPPTPTAANMSATTSTSSQHSTTNAFPSSKTLPFVPFSSSRPRSFSASGVRGRSSPIWSNPARAIQQVNPITNPLPLPCHPRHPVQWEGCGAYFCQYPRPVGDNRTQCPAILKECSDCAVLVCDTCVAVSPTCPCTFCTLNYHCPHCAQKPETRSQCRLEEEIRAKAEQERLAKEKMEKEREDRGKADNVAGAAFEFWTLMGDVVSGMEMNNANENENEHGDEDGDGNEEMPAELIAELPVPSPDSITVTTEFGVSEEPSNITTITAGPTPSYAALMTLWNAGPLLTGDADIQAMQQQGVHFLVPQAPEPQPSNPFQILNHSLLDPMNHPSMGLPGFVAQEQDFVAAQEDDLIDFEFLAEDDDEIFMEEGDGELDDGVLTPATAGST